MTAAIQATFLFILKKKSTEQSTAMICCLPVLNYNTKLHNKSQGKRMSTLRQNLAVSASFTHLYGGKFRGSQNGFGFLGPLKIV